MAKQAGFGVSTCVSIGGDAFIGSPPRKILGMFEHDPMTEAVVMWGEPGTRYEEEVAAFVKNKGFTKPLIAYIAGRFVEEMPQGTVFGHAASIIEGESGKPSVKMALLRDAGCHVVENFNDIIPALQNVMA